MSESDTFNLNRFVLAQETSYSTAIAELRAGKKQSHWSWFVLPQVSGLGTSPMSIRYSISSLDEAKEYLMHPVLGPRLIETVNALLSHSGKEADQILGNIDARKLHSCMTLFSLAAPDNNLFQQALNKYFNGLQDSSTLTILSAFNNESEASIHPNVLTAPPYSSEKLLHYLTVEFH